MIPPSRFMTRQEESERPLEYELKLVVPASRAPFVQNWLASAAWPDAKYPPARVVTVYFDTRGLRFLGEKDGGDYLKTKVRVRWYAGLVGEAIGSPVFAECKYRHGAARKKARVRLAVTAADIATWPLTDPSWTALLAPLRAEVPQLPPDLVPVIRLRYVRCRFADRRGARVTLDSDIRVEATNPARVAAPVASTPLPAAVIEYKAATMDLPRYLAPVVRFGARKAAYSKYLACYEHLTQTSL